MSELSSAIQDSLALRRFSASVKALARLLALLTRCPELLAMSPLLYENERYLGNDGFLWR